MRGKEVRRPQYWGCRHSELLCIATAAEPLGPSDADACSKNVQCSGLCQASLARLADPCSR
jgi:hypothetical protein